MLNAVGTKIKLSKVINEFQKMNHFKIMPGAGVNEIMNTRICDDETCKL
jgi:hypothetical protein